MPFQGQIRFLWHFSAFIDFFKPISQIQNSRHSLYVRLKILKNSHNFGMVNVVAGLRLILFGVDGDETDQVFDHKPEISYVFFIKHVHIRLKIGVD